MERDDLESAVQVLSETYPKAFFVNARQRRPLKEKIGEDIKADIRNNPGSELQFYDVDQVLAWYCDHVGYHKASSVTGAARVDLNGDRAGTVTKSEARVADERATEIFEMIEARKRAYAYSPPSGATHTAPAAPVLKILEVDTSLSDDALLGSIEKHLASLKALAALPDPRLQRELSRPVLLLMIDELETLDARLSA